MEHEYSEEFLIELDRRRIPEGYAPMINRLRSQLVRAQWLARQTLECLPAKRDWLDPDIERELKALAGQKCSRCTETNWCGSCDYDKYRAGQKGGK